MKKVFIYLACFLGFQSAFSQGEWVSASIDNGPTASSTSLFISTTTAFDANKCDNLVFTVRIPVSSGAAVQVTETYKAPAFSHISFSIQKINVTDGTYYYYLVNGTGTVQSPAGITIPTGTSYKVLELAYTNGTSSSIVQLANVENDIPGNNYIRPQFYAQINFGDITNYSTMFYGTGSATPFNNQPPNGDDWVPTPAAVTIPVKFLSFSATRNGDDAQLTWTVENEGAITEKYEVERSLDGIHFETVEMVPAKSNGRSSNSYTDVDPVFTLYSNQVIYYRIKQVDRDNKFIYSDIRSVNQGIKSGSVSIYPNPVKDIATLRLQLTEKAVIHVMVYDAGGKLVQTFNQQGVIGLNAQPVSMKSLAAGKYNIKVIAGSLVKDLQVIKSK